MSHGGHAPVDPKVAKLRNTFLLICAGILTLGAAGVYTVAKATLPQSDGSCASDMRVCPDGSIVGRVPPSCQFQEC